jgi:hypothetical protein
METDRSEQAISTDAERALALQEQMEILQEMVESQKLYLEVHEQQLLELKEQLRYANQEIECMNQELQDMYYQSPTAFSSKCLTLDEAKKLALIILASEKPTQDSLAQLLSAIYGSTVELWELEQRPTPSPIELNPTIRSDIDRSFAEYKQLKVQFKELGTRYVTLKAVFNKFKAQYDEQMNQEINHEPRAKS